MSIKIMSLVWELDLPASEKLVLLALADWANDEGHCWPSIAKLTKKCSKCERTVQLAIKMLVAKGHLTQEPSLGKRCNYTVHPIVRFDTPAESAPPQKLRQPPQKLRPTPAESAPNTLKTHQEPSPLKRAIPANWWPEEFGIGTASRKVVDGWPPGELEAQVEQFRANHAAKGNKFTDPQQAWSTWVLNSRKFGIGKQHGISKSIAGATGAFGHPSTWSDERPF